MITLDHSSVFVPHFCRLVFLSGRLESTVIFFKCVSCWQKAPCFSMRIEEAKVVGCVLVCL